MQSERGEIVKKNIFSSHVFTYWGKTVVLPVSLVSRKSAACKLRTQWPLALTSNNSTLTAFNFIFYFTVYCIPSEPTVSCIMQIVCQWMQHYSALQCEININVSKYLSWRGLCFSAFLKISPAKHLKRSSKQYMAQILNGLWHKPLP